jgi:Smg protein
MKEDIFEVLMYLFENYLEVEIDLLPNSHAIRTELLEAGFELTEVDKAFDWLESLNLETPIEAATATAFRIFSKEEVQRLNLGCRNFIMFLEHAGILMATNRELVIDRIMALDNEDISLEQLKWIVLMVLLSQPDEEMAFSRMEDIVYEDSPVYLH